MENLHRGIVCCVECTPTGGRHVLYSRGNIEQQFYPRSCLKFVQVLPLLESGQWLYCCTQRFLLHHSYSVLTLGSACFVVFTGAAEHFAFTKQEIAVMCSSHNSEQIHIDTVQSILAKAVCIVVSCANKQLSDVNWVHFVDGSVYERLHIWSLIMVIIMSTRSMMTVVCSALYYFIIYRV